MTQRVGVLFEGQKAAGLLRSRWVALGALQPLSTADILEQDLSANRFFRGLWERALPDRRSLPFGALGRQDGTGTDDFWDLLT